MAIKTHNSERHHARIHECEECGSWAYADRGAKHSQISHRRACESREQYNSKPAASAQSIERSAKDGTLYRDHDEQEVLDAVRAKKLSVSDAMNQDM